MNGILQSSVLLMALGMAACGSVHPADNSSNVSALNANSAASVASIYAEGASNTAGFAASFPFAERVKYHFARNGIDLTGKLGAKKVLLSLDYFFPTNFPEYYDASIAPTELGAIVTKKLDALAQRFDYLVMVDLFDKAQLNPTYAAALDPSNHPNLNNIYNALAKDDHAKGSLTAVNDALRAYARSHPNLILSPFAMMANHMAVNGEYEGYGSDDLFGDEVHVNDEGQAVAFNLFFRNQFKRIPELAYVNVPTMSLSLSSSEKTEAIKMISLSNEAFKQTAEGQYWAKIQGFGTFSNPFRRPVSSQGGEMATNENREIMKNLATGIGRASMVAPAEYFLSIERDNKGQLFLGMDLRKSLYFTNIKLAQTEAGAMRFVGYGYDHWTSVSGSPGTNYKFEAVVDAAGVVHVTWTVYPLLTTTVGGQTIQQPHRLVREGFLAEHWIREIEQRGDAYPSLKFQYELKIQN